MRHSASMSKLTQCWQFVNWTTRNKHQHFFLPTHKHFLVIIFGIWIFLLQDLLRFVHATTTRKFVLLFSLSCPSVHYIKVTWASRHLKSPAPEPFVQTLDQAWQKKLNKESTKLCIASPLWGESTSDRRRASNVEAFPSFHVVRVIMSWGKALLAVLSVIALSDFLDIIHENYHVPRRTSAHTAIDRTFTQ